MSRPRQLAQGASVQSAPAGGAGASRVLPGGTVRLTVGYPGPGHRPRRRTVTFSRALSGTLPFMFPAAYVALAAGGSFDKLLKLVMIGSMLGNSLVTAVMVWRRGYDADLTRSLLLRSPVWMLAVVAAFLAWSHVVTPQLVAGWRGAVLVMLVGGPLVWCIVRLWRSEAVGRLLLAAPPALAPSGIRLRLGLRERHLAREIVRVYAERRPQIVRPPSDPPPLLVAVGDTPSGLVLEPGGAVEVQINRPSPDRFDDESEAEPLWLAPPPGPEGWTLVVESLVGGRPHIDVVPFEPPAPSSGSPLAEGAPAS